MKNFAPDSAMRQWHLAVAIILLMPGLSIDTTAQTAFPNPVCYGEPIHFLCDFAEGCDNQFATFLWENSDKSWTSTLRDPVIYPKDVKGYKTDIFHLTVHYSPPPGGFQEGWVSVVVYPKVCCPEFFLKDAVEICAPFEACCPANGSINCDAITACKGTPHTYTVYPDIPGYTYTWTITGGTPAVFTGNPVTVIWGSDPSGFIKVDASGMADGGCCKQTILQKICLIDGPEADFSVDPYPTVCLNTPVHFTNKSKGGSTWLWEFGDGTTSTLANPPDHKYALPGTYTITFTASDTDPIGASSSQYTNCDCSDKVSKTLVVTPDAGPGITSYCCFGDPCQYGTICPGYYSTFCTSVVCTPYNWTAYGGTIVSGVNTNCIKVKWDQNNPHIPTRVTLSTPGCPTAPCPGNTTMYVPVMYPDLAMDGPAILCAGSSGSFSLPTMPGTNYTWSVTGGFYSFNLADRNVPTVNITFYSPGTYTVTCSYNNPLAGCPPGISTTTVSVLPVFSISYLDEKVCEGTPASYSTNGPATWTITPSGASISGSPGNTINVSWNLPGIYTITATPLVPSDFCNANATKVVQVIARPVLGSITGPTDVCPDKGYLYSIISDTDGALFNWTFSGGPTNILGQFGPDQDSAIFQFAGTSPWTISVYQEMEINPGVPCNSATQTLLVNAYGTPVISGPSPVCIDDLPNMYTASGPTPPGGFEWTITPPEQGTIESGQGLNSVNIRWNSTTNPAATLKVTTCGGSDTYTVVVNGPPPVTVTFDKTPVFCHLANETLTLSTASAADSYEWHQIDPAGNDIILPGNSAAEPININNLYLGTYKYYVRIVLDGCDATSNFVEVVIEDCQGGIGSCHCNGIPCPTVAYFRAYPICNRILLKEKSEVFYGASITSYLWTVTPPGHETFDYSTPYSPREPGLTVDASGTYTVTLEVFSATCSTTHSETVIVDLPLSDFTYSTPVCENTPTSFQANQNSPFYQFYWKFGDGSKSFTANTEHAFTPASTYDISLITYDLKGCISPITTKQIVVNPSPPCTITVSNTAFCPGKSVIFSGCSGMDTYQWYRDGSSISGANGQDYTASVPGEYWLEGSYISGGISCTSTSNHIYIYKITPPVAKIEIVGDDHFCVLPSGHVIVKLRCKPDITSYTYNWSSDATATFPPWNNSYQAVQIDVDVTLPAVLPVTYNFIVTVTDIDSWCEARDTICITFYRKPVVTVPLLYTCEGPAFPLASSPSPAGSYYYQWSNGATTPDITAMAPGFYSLTITDKESGCMASADAGFIYPKPDLSLFPLGCYPICNNTPIQLYVPLPLNELPPGDIYPNAYPYIAWYDNSLPFASGHQVSYSTNVTGLHQVSVKVYNNFGCQDSRGVLCLDSKDCLFDFGDAPDDPLPGNYKTNLAGNGARHIIDLSVHLGNNIDQETDGQPTKSADGDDSYGIPDDEDGVTMPAFIWRGALMQITVTASVPGYLDAWIDFDGDKSWDGPADHIFTNQSLVAMPGQNLLYFQVPSNAVLGQSYARFRFRTDNTPVSYEGLVLDGEVEDYAMEIIYCPSSPAGFIPGTIAPSQVIEAGTIPAMLTGSEPTGGTGPYDYQWQVSTTSGEFTDIAGATNLYYAPGALISATYYRLFQSSANGCGSGYTNVATITINPPFSSQLIVQNILVADTRCYNAAQTIYVAGPPSASPSLFYVLNGGHVTMIAGQNIIYYTGTIVVSGGYMNGFIASGGPWCGEKSASIVAAPEGSTELDPVPVKALFIVYPNPTTGGFSLEFTGIGETEEVSVEMYGMHGDRVYAAALKGMKKYDLSLAGKPAGVYFIRVISGKVAGTAKIIRQ